MAKRPQTISLNEVEQAVAAALQQIRQQKATHANELSRSQLIMGRWIRDLEVPQAEAEATAKEITRQVEAKVPGLNATPFAIGGRGGTTMGYVLREE